MFKYLFFQFFGVNKREKFGKLHKNAAGEMAMCVSPAAWF